MKYEVILVVVLATVISAYHIRRIRQLNLDQSPVPAGKEQACVTPDGRDGICLNEKYCTENQTVSKGELSESDIRLSNCPYADDWCCAHANVTATKNGTRLHSDPDDCTLAQDAKSCPWCVAIYRDGGNPRTKTPTGRFCSGVLLGKRVILTAAGCDLSSRDQNVWIKAPSSSTPDKKYSVVSKIRHPSYNSGTREHDIALFTVSEDVHWKDGVQKMGACLGLKTTLTSDLNSCATVGFDSEDKLLFTKLAIKAESCTKQAAVYDAACGTAEENCSTSYGSPLLCPSDSGNLLVAGVVRQQCKEGKVLIGGVVQSSDWLTEQLKGSGLKDISFRQQ